MGSSLSRSRPPSSPMVLKSDCQCLERLVLKEERRALAFSFVNQKSSPSATNDVVYPLPQRGGDGGGQEATKPKSGTPFSQFSIVSSAGSYSQHNYSDDLDELQLTRRYRIGPNTSVDTVLEGTRIKLQEFRSSLLHKFGNLHQDRERKIWNDGQITLCALTDFHLQHRLTLESILGSEEKGKTFAAFVSTEFESGISWGLANTHRPYNKLTLLSRFTSDDYAGKRLILQAVQILNDRNTLSPVCALTLGSQPQAGISWRHLGSQPQVGISWRHQFNSWTNDSFQVKAFYSKEGSSLVMNANVGEV